MSSIGMHSTAISLSTSSAVTIYSGFVAPESENTKYINKIYDKLLKYNYATQKSI